MPRGRPRQFDEEQALESAMLLFWEKGLSSTSLDELADAMGMNRPSIYNAFGSKEALYRRALNSFCGRLDQGMEQTLETVPNLRDALRAFYRSAIAVYCSTSPAMGCLMVCTAPGEALSHPEVGADLQALIQRLDAGLTLRLSRAQREGELPDNVQPELAACLLQATLQTIALRARAGVPRKKLEAIADYAIDQLAA